MFEGCHVHANHRKQEVLAGNYVLKCLDPAKDWQPPLGDKEKKAETLEDLFCESGEWLNEVMPYPPLSTHIVCMP